MVIAPSASDLESSKSWLRSISETVPRPSQRGHMPPVRVKVTFSVLRGTAFDGDRTACSDRGDIEGERVGRADVRLSEPAEEDAQHRVSVGGGAHRGTGVGAHAAAGRR